MPIYLYRNLATGETFEYEQRIADDALTTHPETGEPVKRLIQPVGIAFKGSGFYVNDARKSGSHSGGKAAPAADSGGHAGASAATQAAATGSAAPSSGASSATGSATAPAAPAAGKTGA